MNGGTTRPAQPDVRAWSWLLPALVAILPFEPRRPALPLGAGQVTLLEAAAAVVTLVLLWQSRARLRALLRPPAPLAFLFAYAGTHVLSAALAPTERGLALKFALRMAAMAVFAAAVALSPPEARRRGIVALVLGASLVALLAVLEGAGVRVLDPFLDRFREMPFNVGGLRRASAGSEYPNLAAAFLMCALVAGAALGPRWYAPVAVLLAGGLLFTYSRGALVAAAVGLLAVALALRRAGQRLRAPAIGVGLLAAASLAFALGGEIFRLRLGTEGTERWYGATYLPGDSSLTLRPGESRVARIRVINSGLKTWSNAEAFHLSYHWYDVDRHELADGGRTSLPADVRPGESVELGPEVRAPGREGRYLLVWDMVHENTTWFSGQGVRPAEVPVRVAGGPEVPASAASGPSGGLAWHPTRGELWSVAAGMWRERPLLGFGPDSFRRLYGARAGHALWDTRVFANNTLLEVAATTGTLGVLALAGALLTSALRAWRGVRAPSPIESAALFGLTIALAAHGMVDYVLAFTGHYLLLGFVVGAASALPRSGGPA